MVKNNYFSTYIYPLVLAIILIPVSALITPLIENIFTPEKEVLIQLSATKEVLTAKEVGNRKHELFGQNVDNSYITTMELVNIGKVAIDDYLFTIDVDTDKVPSLFRVFYTTTPPHSFGPVAFSNVGTTSKKVIIDNFVEGNQLNISIISSELFNVTVTPNTTGVISHTKFKEVDSSYSMFDLVYVAIFSSLFIFLFRILYDLIPWLISRFSSLPDA
jgi:hypothetical protein